VFLACFTLDLSAVELCAITGSGGFPVPPN
jgi:hypothetical protein